MSLEDQPHDIRLKAQYRGPHLAALRWYLRLRLRWVRHDIDELERRLGVEFATSDVAALHAQLLALVSKRDALVARLESVT